VGQIGSPQIPFGPFRSFLIGEVFFFFWFFFDGFLLFRTWRYLLIAYYMD